MTRPEHIDMASLNLAYKDAEIVARNDFDWLVKIALKHHKALVFKWYFWLPLMILTWYVGGLTWPMIFG